MKVLYSFYLPRLTILHGQGGDPIGDVVALPTRSLRSVPSPVGIFLRTQANPHTQRAFAQALRRAATVHFGKVSSRTLDSLPWHNLRYHDLEVLKAALIEQGYAISTVNLTLAAVRGVLAHCGKLHLLSPEDLDEIRDVRRADGQALPAGRALADRELHGLFSQATALPSPLRERDLALLAVAFTAGARRAEIAALDLADYRAQPPTIRLRSTKGRRRRHAQLSKDATAHLARWLSVRGSEPGALLCPVRGAQLAVGIHITPGAIYQRLHTLSKRAGIPPVTPHDARRTVATRMLAAGADLATVARQTGHVSLGVLRVYDRRGDEAVRHAVDGSLHLPTPSPIPARGSPTTVCRVRSKSPNNYS